MKRTRASLLIVATAVGTADANVEIGGIAGVHLFNQNSELGVYDRPDATSQRNSLLAGLRIGAYALDAVGVEAELGVIPTVARETGFSVIDVTYRAHLVALLRAKDPTNKALPFVLVGAGAMSVVVSKNANYKNDMARTITGDTDAAYYFGAGVKYRAGREWGIRADVRVLAVPSSENTLPPDPDTKKTTVDFEAMVSIYLDSRRGPEAKATRPLPPVDDDADKDTIRGAADQCPTDPEDSDGYLDDDGCPDADNDADGLVDGEDRCPLEAEDRDGFQDSDGCPERDNDGDGLVDNIDTCPGEAEDKDGFEDEDGCPDPDNDGDGVTDGLDRCADTVETRNGYLDDDGCADAIPEVVLRFTTGSSAINFRVNSAEMSPRSRKELDATAIMLVDNHEVRLEIRAHTDRKDTMELSVKRAEAVRDYLIKKGVNASRLIAKGFGDGSPLIDPAGLTGRKLAVARAQNRRIELRLAGRP
jgi:outer membrane protein OmpA-like peptidoglycan-associated protein